MSDQHPTDPTLHPRHPGRGCTTSLIAAEGDEAEQGGVFLFFPSGATKVIGWRQVQPITPTLDAAKQYAAKVIEALQRDGLHSDIDRTNWVSVTAAIQRIIMDWNDSIKVRIGTAWAREFREGMDPLRGAQPKRMH